MKAHHPPSTQSWDRIWIGAHLLTVDQAEGLGEYRDAVLAIKDGRIAWLGSREQLAAIQWSAHTVTEAHGQWITPGLIECHTHLVYAGDRSNEFAARLRGATYEEISRAGGGIVSTMRATRSASDDELFEQSLPRALALASEGVTTLEIKSGYGLDLANELKMLRVARRIGEHTGLTVIKTFLGAHALPPEFAGRQDDYVRHVCDDMLPAAAAARLADAVDVFCERIAFTQEQTRRVFEQARRHGLQLRLHADQLSDGSGGEIAADCGALSADHLEYASERSLQRMAEQGVVAGLLPGAFYYLRETKLPPIERLRELQVAMAVSTDCNPGTSPLASLLTAMNMACVIFRLTATEAWRGVTINAARALGLEDRGVLRVGARADLAIWKIRHPEQLCAELGVHRPVEIVLGA
ncbi:MAG: imidazolonepropionase [Steroidobacter sp.]